MFQASNARDRHFFNLPDDDLHLIESLYTKEGLWIKHFRHLNSLCARVTRVIVNHAPIEEYHLCFFSNEYFSYSCRKYPIESRCHTLHNCKRFNNYWNLKQNTIGHFVSFLVFNKNIFSFGESIT